MWQVFYSIVYTGNTSNICENFVNFLGLLSPFILSLLSPLLLSHFHSVFPEL
jgi:hypothetical protein